MARYLLIILIVVFCLFCYGISGASEKLNVVASFYPLAHFAEQVGSEHVKVVNIMPPGVEPHEFEPTPRDMKEIWGSKVFIFNGAGIDPWAERIQKTLKEKGILTVEISRNFILKKSAKNKYRDFNNDMCDPHVWIDPLLAQKEIEIIRDAFIKVDPENEYAYRNNSVTYINKLSLLNKKYKEGLRSCKIRTIVVSHNAFSYLARRNNLNIIPLAGISPEEEPSPRRMAEISKIARNKNIQYIFFEPLVSPKVAKTVAREIGVKTLTLNPVEGLTEDEIMAGKDYISIMEENLQNLRKALSCK